MPTAEQLREVLEAEGLSRPSLTQEYWVVSEDDIPRIAARLSTLRLDAGGGGEKRIVVLGQIADEYERDAKPHAFDRALDRAFDAGRAFALSTQPRTEDGRSFEDGFEAAKKVALAAMNEAAVGLPSKGEGPLYEAFAALEALSPPVEDR